ncbi:MAG: hypothetical protein AB2598_02510 [Candidatus Thiodiazotropha sp.]
MKRVYDMSTGQIVDSCRADESRPAIAPDATLPELQLQLVTPDQRTEREIPPELVMADLCAFLEKMG